jgi:hypothetical protein
VPARDLEWDHHPVAGLEVGDLRAYLLDYAHRLVTQDITLFEEGGQHLVEVQIRAANIGRRDANYGIGRLLDGGSRDVVYPYIPLAMPRKGLHLCLPLRSGLIL